MQNVDKLRSYLANPPHPCLLPWLQRVINAFDAANGVQGSYATTFQSPDCVEYHARYMQPVSVRDLIIEAEFINAAGEPESMDEEALPFCLGQFTDGAVMLVEFDEIFSRDERLNALYKAVASGFALACDMDFTGPFGLVEYGTDADRARFQQEVGTYVIKDCMEKRINAPKEFFKLAHV